MAAAKPPTPKIAIDEVKNLFIPQKRRSNAGNCFAKNPHKSKMTAQFEAVIKSNRARLACATPAKRFGLDQ
jgi:hypothetical protein